MYCCANISIPLNRARFASDVRRRAADITACLKRQTNFPGHPKASHISMATRDDDDDDDSKIALKQFIFKLPSAGSLVKLEAFSP